MPAELSIRKDGFVEFAFTGSRDAIWHGLGNELERGASIEKWRESSGLDWNILESDVEFRLPNFTQHTTFEGKKVLYRSDTKEPLSIVGSKFKVVQPGEVLEFFRDLTAQNGMTLTTAGALFGGTRFWAQAELGKEMILANGDKVNGNLLLITSADGTLSTQAKFVSTRVVCNNTLAVALGEHGKHLVKKTHRSDFVAKNVKLDLGVIDEGWDKFKNNIMKLASNAISDKKAEEFIKSIVAPKSDDLDKLGPRRKFQAIKELYYNGTGAELSRGSLWGVLNAFTEFGTHGTGRKGGSSQFNSSEFGEGASMKSDVYSKLLEYAE